MAAVSVPPPRVELWHYFEVTSLRWQNLQHSARSIKSSLSMARKKVIVRTGTVHVSGKATSFIVKQALIRNQNTIPYKGLCLRCSASFLNRSFRCPYVNTQRKVRGLQEQIDRF